MDRVSNQPHRIGGRAVAGTAGRAGDVFDLSLGIVTARAALAVATEVDVTVRTAREAYQASAATPTPERVRTLFQFRQTIEPGRAELARIIASEHGELDYDAAGFTP